MNRACQAGPSWVCGLLLLVLGLGLGAPAWAEPRPVTLKSGLISDFASPPPAADRPTVKPAFKEKDFPLKDAENHKEVQALIGALSPVEKAFLEKNRFLIRPKPSFLPEGAEGRAAADEMLAWFDALGGSSLRSERKPANARLVSPDVFLHAWHKYMEGRLAAVERGVLLKTARLMLADLFRNAVDLRAEAAAGISNWERLLAQLVVPLILLEEAEKAIEEGPDYGGEQQRALDRFEKYRPEFSSATARRIRSELIRIHRAEAASESLLGLAPADGAELVDYRLFQPRGRYAGDAAGRGYHRAMTWLGRLGWDARTEGGLADALNCALAMSYERAGRAAEAPGEEAAGEGQKSAALAMPDGPHQAWLRFMEISAFFLGYPESPGYLEWLPFLMKEAEVPEFTASTSSEEETLSRLAQAADTLAAPARPYFKDWPAPGPRNSGRVICLLPQRRSPSELIAAELRGRPGGQAGLPLVSSALWLPVLLGHPEAEEMLPRQVALTRPSPSADGPAPKPLPDAVEALSGRLARLSARIQAEPEAAWFATSETARLKALSALIKPGESGYPLYMRSPAFSIRRLESVLGAYTELRHEAAAPPPADPAGAAAPAPSEPLVDDRPPALPVKGLVEPSDFWREMIRVAGHTRSGFRKYGLFPEDLEDFGPLTRFIKRLERCAALAEQELSGQELSEDDYEFIRLFSLGWMAQPPGGGAGPQPEEQVRSGLTATLQELPPEIGGGLRVYEATAEPWLMLALVGNEKSPRLVLGLAYSHYEFAGPFEPHLSDLVWQLAAYARYLPSTGRGGPSLPARNFWYEALQP